jgi:hypothetical protein
LVIKLLCYVNLTFFIAHRRLKKKQPSYNECLMYKGTVAYMPTEFDK